jgi:hypothetical protein
MHSDVLDSLEHLSVGPAESVNDLGEALSHLCTVLVVVDLDHPVFSIHIE